MSGHVWTQVDMLIDPASGLKKSNWFAYHFRIPLYHTSAKRIKKRPNTSMIPGNLEHWVCPFEHLGWPVRRKRSFWLGYLKDM